VRPIVYFFAFIFIGIPLVLYLLYLIYKTIKNTDSGMKSIVLGLHVTLFGGILVLDDNTDFLVFGYVIASLGLILSMIGMSKAG
jgi:hypothetical protein